MTTDVDLIIAGGGPVGLAASIEARLAGLSVAVIEPRDGAIDKACGEGLMPGALPLLARLGVDPVGMPLAGVSYRNGSTRADHYFASGPGRGVRRTTLHTALAERASELGVERVAGKVESIDQDSSGVTAGGLRGSWLFGCDGLHSTVRRLAGLGRTALTRRRRFGIRRHFIVEPWSHLIEVHWGANAEAYVTPVSESLVGVAILGARHTNYDEAIRAIPQLADRLRGAEPATPIRGAGPFRQRSSSPVAGRVLLVGDASGYVDAITGEGLRLGFDQARVAVESVLAGRPERYASEWRSVTRDFRVLTSGLVAAAASPLRHGIVPTAHALPKLYGSIVERLAR